LRRRERKRNQSEKGEDCRKALRHRNCPISTMRWNFCTSRRPRQRSGTEAASFHAGIN
jgi:hypothetical protein